MRKEFWVIKCLALDIGVGGEGKKSISDIHLFPPPGKKFPTIKNEVKFSQTDISCLQTENNGFLLRVSDLLEPLALKAVIKFKE